MWTKTAVDEALRTHIDDKARASHLAIEIEELERRINTAVRQLASDEAGPRAQVITDMPHGTDVGNPTEELGIRLASGWMPPEIKEMRAQSETLKCEYNILAMRNRYVDAWLGVLTERENWVMLHQYMRQEYWRDILDDYTRQFGQYASKDTLKRMRDRALQQIYTVARIRS